MNPHDPDASTLPPTPARAPEELATLPPDSRATPVHDPWSTQAGQTPAADFSAALGLPVMERYDILEELGRGGMGVDYKARQFAGSLDSFIVGRGDCFLDLGDSSEGGSKTGGRGKRECQGSV